MGQSIDQQMDLGTCIWHPLQILQDDISNNLAKSLGLRSSDALPNVSLLLDKYNI